jgi:hypothetical protein
MIDTLGYFSHFFILDFILFVFFSPSSFYLGPVDLNLFVGHLVGLDAHDIGAVLFAARNQASKIDVNGFLDGFHEASGLLCILGGFLGI